MQAEAARAANLTDSIADVVDRLYDDLEQGPVKKSLYNDIFEIRRLLNSLEREVRGEEPTTIGEAC